METPLSARSGEIKEPNVVEILLPWLQKKISQHFSPLWYISFCTKGQTGFLRTRLWTKIQDSESSPGSRKSNSQFFFPEKDPQLVAPEPESGSDPVSVPELLPCFLAQGYTGCQQSSHRVIAVSLKARWFMVGWGRKGIEGKEVLSRRGWSHAIIKLTAGKASPESVGILCSYYCYLSTSFKAERGSEWEADLTTRLPIAVEWVPCLCIYYNCKVLISLHIWQKKNLPQPCSWQNEILAAGGWVSNLSSSLWLAGTRADRVFYSACSFCS